MSPRLEMVGLATAGGLLGAAPFLVDALAPVVFIAQVPLLFLVASGLNAGELLITRPLDRLADGRPCKRRAEAGPGGGPENAGAGAQR